MIAVCMPSTSAVPQRCPETTSGAKTLKFYSSHRLDIRRIGAISEGENFTGTRVRLKVKKTKVAPPYKKCEFDIL